MAREEVLSGILFDRENTFETAKHSKTHNRFHSNESVEQIEQKLIEDVIHRIDTGEWREANIEQTSFDVWFVVDSVADQTRFNVEPMASERPKYEVNLFVRLGRTPVMEEVG